MGDVTEMILEGILCKQCGQYIGKSVGYPQKCMIARKMMMSD
jgi:hypothetical protein